MTTRYRKIPTARGRGTIRFRDRWAPMEMETANGTLHLGAMAEVIGGPEQGKHGKIVGLHKSGVYAGLVVIAVRYDMGYAITEAEVIAEGPRHIVVEGVNVKEET